MAYFSFPKQPFSDSVWAKLLSILHDAFNKWDYDSGWVARGTGVFNHNLNQLPRQVVVNMSSSASGDDYASGIASVVTTSSITVVGSAAYYRVLANK